MRFLWKSQLRKERGKFLVKNDPIKKKNRKERLHLDVKHGYPFVGVGLLWLLFFGTSGYLALFSPYLSLESPQIEGLEQIDDTIFRASVEKELEQQYFHIFSRNRYFLVRPEKLEQTLRSEYPLIQSVRVERTFPNKLRIDVSERSALLLWCSGDACFHVLEDGSVIPVTSVYQETENEERTLKIHDLSGQPLSQEKAFEPDFVRFPVAIRQALLEQFSISTEREMSLASRFANELRVRTTDGWEIFFSTRVPLDTSLQALRLLFEKEIADDRRHDLQYIDLRTENRIFYRYQEGKETVGTPAEEHVLEDTKDGDAKKSKKK